MRDLLAEDGSIWVSIDDNEAHITSRLLWMKFLGGSNFVANVIWQKTATRKMEPTAIRLITRTTISVLFCAKHSPETLDS